MPFCKTIEFGGGFSKSFREDINQFKVSFKHRKLDEILQKERKYLIIFAHGGLLTIVSLSIM